MVAHGKDWRRDLTARNLADDKDPLSRAARYRDSRLVGTTNCYTGCHQALTDSVARHKFRHGAYSPAGK